MWFEVENVSELDSPSLLIYKDRVAENIKVMVQIAGGTERLMVHVKTNKMPEIVKMMLANGILKFKCATIAEAEMVASAGGKYIVIAHQLVGPKIERLVRLQKMYPDVFFASLLDCSENAIKTNEIFEENQLIANVFVDINNGMNRSGHPLNGELLPLYQNLLSMPHLNVWGLHVYDGHLREPNFDVRKHQIDEGFVDVQAFIDTLSELNLPRPMLIAGGTPAFTSHAMRANTFCSPGTCVLWDWGYGDKLSEQTFDYAALVLTRIISKPQEGLIAVDMGHKAIAAENAIDKRIRFLNLEYYELLSQSEEHGVLRVENWDKLQVGDVLYGVPYHICPTVNLYDEAYVVENGRSDKIWEISARKRKISI